MNEAIRQNKKGDEDSKKNMMAFFNQLRKKTTKQNQRTIKLPDKLMYILEGCSDAYVDILNWSTDGTSIIIKKPKAFEEIICPLYFDKKCTFDSFSRKLRRWGFSTRRVPCSKVEGMTDQKGKLWVCRHPYFTRSSAFQGSSRMSTAITTKKEVLSPDTSNTLMADSSVSIMNHFPIVRNKPSLQRKSQHGTAVMAGHLSPSQHASSRLSNSNFISIEPSIDSLEAQICQTQVQLRYEYERLLMLLTKSPRRLRSEYVPQFSGAYQTYNMPFEAGASTSYNSFPANQRKTIMSSQKFVQVQEMSAIQEQEAQEDVNTYRRAAQQQQQLLMIGKSPNYNHKNRGHSSSGASIRSNFRREFPVCENDLFHQEQSGYSFKRK